MDLSFYKEMLKKEGRELSILCAEDDNDAREQMKNILLSYFGKVHVAKDGAEALSLYAQFKYDLVLSDINMPNMNGIEFSKTIKEINESQKIIIISAYNDSEFLVDLIDIGVDGFLLKPIDRTKLITTLYKMQKSISDERMIEDFQNKLMELNVELENKNNELENSIKMLRKEENKNVALVNMVVQNQEMQSEDLEYFQNKRNNKMNSKEFLETYPIDIESRVLSLEKIIDTLDIQVNKIVNGNISSLKHIADTFAECSEIFYSMGEFNNLAYAMESISITLLELKSIEKTQVIKSLLFEINTNLEKWVRFLFVEQSADDIHYLDDSFINDAIMIEKIVMKKDETKKDDDEGEILFL